MTIEFWWTGKTQAKYLNQGINDYVSRIQHFQRFEIREHAQAKARRPEDQVIMEDQQLQKNLDQRDFLILLDEKGKQMTSSGFAGYLDTLLTKPSRKIIFAIGGAYGFGDSMRNRADHLLALSSMTFTHDIVRLVFLEQLYRAFTIKNNLPYHH
ncbi:MAG: 23S rRNA (pseudouridine(1915)-N(3))-methyltransferase RlmH [Saprospiraceae bacterium]|nr:23S rRNA (pseudouridine(1915)-N(3))-methyltransferase RlmH [Saprospiraceae bacterium]